MSYPQRSALFFPRADKLAVSGSTSATASPFGRPVSITLGSTALLPAASGLPSDVFTSTLSHYAGPTSARPAPTDGDFPGAASMVGLIFFDTTIAAPVIFDGVNYRNVFTSAIA